MSTFKNYREESRAIWGQKMEEGKTLDREQIQLGAILRIADALEKFAENFDFLRRDRDWQLERVKSLTARLDKAERSNRALRGYLKQLKPDVAVGATSRRS